MELKISGIGEIIVESMGAILNLMGIERLDMESIKKIQALGEFGKENDC